MKKIKFEGKLKLNKETISKLNDEQMKHANGGGTILTTWYNCATRRSCVTICQQTTCGTGGTSNYISECIGCNPNN